MGADTEGKWAAPVKIPIAPTKLYDPYDRRRTVTDARGLFVIHAVLLRTGKVLWFCGHTETLFYPPIGYLFDRREPAKVKAIPMPDRTDLFCCHFVQLYDGRILIVGGSEQDETPEKGLQYHGSSGSKSVVIFDPESESWTEAKALELEQGRWYPTAVLLADGRTVIVSGRVDSAAAGTNPLRIAERVEVISPRADRRTTLPPAAMQLPIYPGLHLGPDGRIYTSHTTWGQEINEPDGMALEVGETQASWTVFPQSKPAQDAREEGMSVVLPVTLPRSGSRGRILVVGGGRAIGVRRSDGAPGFMAALGGIGNAIFAEHQPGVDTKSVEVLDTTTNPPTWSKPPGAMKHSRVNGHCVLLPDATVLILGGHDGYKWQAKENLPSAVGEVTTNPTLPVEIYTPGVGFTEGAPMKHPRMYHSIALLLDDGRVIVAGGADPNANEPGLVYPDGWKGRKYTGGGPGVRKNGHDPSPLNRKDYEIYSPPYLCKGLPQPEIDKLSNLQVEYGDIFTITTQQAASIEHVAIMRPGAVTHHTDSEQRYVELEKSPPQGNTITVTMVPKTEAAIAPPGYYMVWIVDGNGVPCKETKWIQVVHSAPWPDPPPPEPPKPDPQPDPPKPDPVIGPDCLFLFLLLGSVDAPRVGYLRGLRHEISSAGPLGRRLVTAVNGAYYAVSPRLVRWLARHDRASDAVRDVVVRPGTAAIRAADAATRRFGRTRTRTAVLVALLVVEAVLTAAAAPAVGAALAVRAALPRRRRPTKERDDG